MRTGSCGYVYCWCDSDSRRIVTGARMNGEVPARSPSQPELPAVLVLKTMPRRVLEKRSRKTFSTSSCWPLAFSTSTSSSVFDTDSTKGRSAPCSVNGRKEGKVCEALEPTK